MKKTVGELIDSEAVKNVQRLGFSLGLLRRNHAELSLAIRYLTSQRIAHEMGGIDDRWHRQEGMHEVVCLLHNFVSSAKSLIDHTRRIHQKDYQPKQLRVESERQIKERFLANPLAQFVEDLREMAQHYRLPSVGIRTSFVNKPSGTEMTVRLHLTKTDLKEYRRWGPHSKAFLEEAPEQIDLLQVVDDYHAAVAEFHAWFRSRQDQTHGVWSALRERLTTDGVHSPEPAIIKEVTTRLEVLASRAEGSPTFAELHIALLPALTIWDSRRLMLCEHDAHSWLTYALSAIDRRFTLPEEVRARLWSFVAP